MAYPQFTEMDPGRLRKNSWNSNIVTPENDRKLEESIKRNGLFKPVVVRELEDGALEIIGGEHRWEVAQRLGINPIMVVNLGTVTDQKAKEISVIDNARYGDDDTLAFADLLKEIGSSDTIRDFLPFADDDLTSIFSSADIALDDLNFDLSGLASKDPEDDDPAPVAKPPKTHTIMRYKVSNTDAERLTALIASTQKAQGFTAADDLTNAGDAIVYLLLSQGSQA